jgi:hypothetical protein
METKVKKHKKVDYKVMSDRKCVICGAPIKQNVIMRAPHTCHCFVCCKLNAGILFEDKHRMVNDEKRLIKRLDYVKIQKDNKRKYLRHN